MRLEARLAPPQAPARVGVLGPQSERLRMLHQRRQHRQRPVRRPRARDREIVEPVAHDLRGNRIDASIAEGGQNVPAHAVRVRSPCRGLPSFGTVGEERRAERPHRRDCRRCAARIGIGDQRTRRMPCFLDRQRVERSERPPDDGAIAPSMHDPRLASVRAHAQAEPRRDAVPQHGLAYVRRHERARSRRGDLRLVRHVPIPSVRFGCDRRGASAPVLGNTQDTPGNRAGFGDRKGLKCRAQSPHGLQAVVTTGLSAHLGCVGVGGFLTPWGVGSSHPTHR